MGETERKNPSLEETETLFLGGRETELPTFSLSENVEMP